MQRSFWTLAAGHGTLKCINNNNLLLPIFGVASEKQMIPNTRLSALCTNVLCMADFNSIFWLFLSGKNWNKSASDLNSLFHQAINPSIEFCNSSQQSALHSGLNASACVADRRSLGNWCGSRTANCKEKQKSSCSMPFWSNFFSSM